MVWMFSLPIPHGMHLLVPAHPPSFRWYVIPVGHFPQKSLGGNPRIGFLFSPPPYYTISYLWPMTHHSCIGWVQVGSAWVLRVLHFCVLLKLVCCPFVCHGLKARLCILLLILDPLWRELLSDFSFLTACSFQGLCFAWLCAFPSWVHSLLFP